MAGKKQAKIATTVAGSQVADSLKVIEAYVDRHGGTIARYDALAGTSKQVSLEMVVATRMVSSRISNEQASWFVQHAVDAPWKLVPRNASLVDADPRKEGGLFDKALELYNYFDNAAPKYVAEAKIHKVLYLMRPSFFPILDSHLMAAYSSAATSAAAACKADRPGFKLKKSWWEAIRLDLVRNEDRLKAIRSVEVPAQETIAKLTDLRLLDILAWSL